MIIKNVDEIHYQGKKAHLIEDRYGKQNNSWMTFTKINIWKRKLADSTPNFADNPINKK